MTSTTGPKKYYGKMAIGKYVRISAVAIRAVTRGF
jgi:hypothetical protein